MARADANSNAEAGIILRFHDPDNYIVALYSPLLKAIYVHDRKNGQWGEQLGRIDVPEIGPHIHLTAAACRDNAAMILTDGTKTYYTPIVQVSNATQGTTGLWLYQIGERQEYGNFEVLRAEFAPFKPEIKKLLAKDDSGTAKESPLVMHENPNIVPAITLPEVTFLPGDEYRPPRLPAPQDWVLVLEKDM